MRRSTRTRSWIVAAAAMFGISATATADTITWDGGGDGTSWHDAANWSGNVVPGPADDAVIGAAASVVVSAASGNPVVNSIDCDGALTLAGGTLTIASTSAIDVYTQSGGTLTGDGDVTVSGLMTWSSGGISGAGTLFADGGIDMTVSTKNLDRRLESTGTTTWSGGQFRIVTGRFVNMPGVLFEAQGDDLLWNLGFTGTFENRGVFRKTVGVATTDINLPFDNQGSVDIQTGTVFFRAGSTHTGSIAGPGVTRFGTGVHMLEASSSVTTEVLVESGTTNVLGSFDVPRLTLSSGTLDVDATTSLQIGVYAQSVGTLTGDGDVTVSGLMTWSGGGIGGAGTLFADGGIDMTTSTKNLDRRLESTGTTTWSGGQFRIVTGRFVNMPGVLFEAQGDDLLWNLGFTGTFENRGVFRKTVGVATTDINLPFDNQGSVDIQTGTVFFRAGSTHTGSIAGPGVTRFGTGVHMLEASSSVTTEVLVESGTTNVLGSFDVPRLTLSSGTLDVDATTSLQIGEYAQSVGTLTGDGDVTVSGLMTWSSGGISGAGTLFADGGIDMTTSTKNLDRRLESTGTTTWSGGQFRIVTGRFVNMPGALFEAQGDDLLWNLGFTGTFENRGVFRKSQGTGVTEFRMPLENSGTVEVLSGILFIREPYTQTAGATHVEAELEFDTGEQLDLLVGELSGNGLVDGFVNNDGGTIRPGLSPGQLSVEGDVDQTILGTLVVELGGTKPGEFDVLAIDGDAFLGGLLEIRRFEGYIPAVGLVFPILTTTGSRFDTFDETQCEDFFLIRYLDQGVELEVLAELSPADLNQDCSVGFADLQILLQAWGPCSPPPPAFCLADLNDNGGVGFADLQILLQSWG